ncbi:phosphatidylinositol mannoside acyltransferase [Catenulispora subtropica]|uniref:Phosphatidylinositol mannoside acyltransferase n=1 Tax=Catenulispora subtropica TaxID=450798 RepID=A0ABN2QNN4_9ACTN
MSTKDRVVEWGYGAAWSAVKLLPERAAYRLFDFIADRLWARRTGQVRQLEKNLLRVLGKDTPEKELREASHLAMRSALRQYCEQFRAPVWSRERVTDSVDFPADDIEILKAAMASGRGTILALGHTGNYDHAGMWLINFTGEGFTTVAEHLKPEAVGEKFLDYRRGLGMEVLPHDAGPTVFGTLARRLRAGKIVALVADRDLSANGAEVQMFGEATRIAAGPAALAVQTGAVLLPVQLWYPSSAKMSIRVLPEIPVPAEGTRQQKIAAMSQQLADAYAAGIAAHPTDWHMLQKFFLADLDPAKAPKPRPADTVEAS